MLRFKSNVFLSSETEESMSNEPPEKPENVKKLSSIDTTRFNSQGMIIIDGEFNHQLAGNIHTQFESAIQAATKMNRDYVILIIDSIGGFIAILNKIIGLMHLYRPKPDFKYVGVAIGLCNSSGFNLLQNCDWRVGLSSSSYVFHFGSKRFGNQALSNAISDPEWYLKSEYSYLTSWLQIISKRSGQSIEFLKMIARMETQMTPEIALEYNFIDEIVDCTPERSVKVEFTLFPITD